jgi:hypothetical protein
MQLRAARLCLDCEELHVGDACPVCASERFAFLSAWLPSEERRRWRRQPPVFPQPAGRGIRRVARLFSDWISGRSADPPPVPRTRASDHVPRLDFDRPGEAQPTPNLEPRPAQATKQSGT